ncbi:hypothetical protein PQE74_gp119 [Bacillus phage vB_BanS_Chewbecca]|uniref:Uncharacterized protein n=3 Tax=Tsamsavirus TaxID=3044849 RepID=A0AAE9CEE0_9CAUD|nr:hypothetical protein PQE72_gp144 [Bacillus phage vB_BanS_Skywalker]YP_010681022.1 hypothetical protein PQE73_gp126 [Bacillus phage vB_BanS_MrDarsey]YP_010681262.1 hypothetical protein PQE74_gp119 [Bacillus phage vB_BanS_Chewbecca]UGO46202.1 hypothetical protein CHEWBECCA_119 [Bacillus phage vB_BanS_Chewbecca]UGO47958.1 hypothetical protein MRDARSEY_126 [Bacillus phage vB_BanS_MrDarsey]UGO51299.1 hypothetical protein SKYWALKER_142 [Bacillus phage vB_BanS_Skywalker]
MEKKEVVVAYGGRGVFPNSELVGKLREETLKVWTPETKNLASEIPQDEEVQTLEEAIEEVARENGLTVEEVKEYLHKFQRDLYKKYTKKKVDKTKAKAKRKQAKKSKKKNR